MPKDAVLNNVAAPHQPSTICHFTQCLKPPFPSHFQPLPAYLFDDFHLPGNLPYEMKSPFPASLPVPATLLGSTHCSSSLFHSSPTLFPLEEISPVFAALTRNGVGNPRSRYAPQVRLELRTKSTRTVGGSPTSINSLAPPAILFL